MTGIFLPYKIRERFFTAYQLLIKTSVLFIDRYAYKIANTYARDSAVVGNLVGDSVEAAYKTAHNMSR